MTHPEKTSSPEMQSAIIPLSQEMSAAVRSSLRGIYGPEPLDVADLLNSILKEDNLGSTALFHICSDRAIYRDQNTFSRFSQLLSSEAAHPHSTTSIVDSISLGKHTHATTQVLSSVILRSRSFSYDDHISTGDIIVAEITRENSILRRLLEESGVDTSDIESYISAFISGLQDRSSDFREGRGFESLNISSTQADFGESDFQQNVNFRNLIIESDRQSDQIIKVDWVEDLLSSLEENTVVVVASEHEDEVLSVLESTAHILGNGANVHFNYEGVIVPDFGSLEEDYNSTINKAVRAAKGGILYLPSVEKYLQNPTLRRSLAKKELKLITSATEAQFKHIKSVSKHIEKGHLLFLKPPTTEEAIQLLTEDIPSIQNSFSQDESHLIDITQEAIEEAVKLTQRYMGGASLLRGSKSLIMRSLTEIKMAMAGIGEEREYDLTIDERDVQLALQKLTGIEVAVDDPEKYLHMEETLGESLIGQPEAIEAVSRKIRQAKAGLKDPEKPIGSFFFLGPSGVGKTELAKQLSEFLFDDRDMMIRIDMSEYQEKHSTARLFGAPPGYTGYEEGGQLTEAVLKRPYSVIVFDEIEKAHPDVADVLLQVLDDGRMTDGKGRTVDFRNTIVIMTSNVGSDHYLKTHLQREEIISRVEKDLEKTFKPEFINRLDEKIVFNALTPENMVDIAKLIIGKETIYIQEQGVSFELTQEALDYLAVIDYDPRYGARPLERTISKYVVQPIGDKILAKKYVEGDSVMIDFNPDSNSLVFEKK